MKPSSSQVLTRLERILSLYSRGLRHAVFSLVPRYRLRLAHDEVTFSVIGRSYLPRFRVYIVEDAIDFLSFRDANMPRLHRSQQLGGIHTMQFADNPYRPVVRDVDLPSFDAESVLKEMFVPSKDELQQQQEEGDIVSKDELQQQEEGEIVSDEPECPLCRDKLQYDEVETKKGEPWCYYRCPAVADYTKCFVACGAADVTMYLHRIKETLHSIYKPGPASFDPACMRCFCQMSLILALSRSDKNRHRLYFKCPKGQSSTNDHARFCQTPTGRRLSRHRHGMFSSERCLSMS